MEITFDSIIGLLGLLLGGSIGSVFTWRWQRRKAKAEAVQAEVETAKDKQEYYRGIVEDISKDRDYYKQERDEIRERMDKMAHSFMDWRMEADRDRMDMKMQIAKLGRKVETMVPFMCGNLTCKDRQRVVLSEDGTPKDSKKKKKPQAADVEPLEQEAL